MYKRKIILLINGFSVYKTNINLYINEIHKGFRNIIIFFFSKNETALC